MVKTFPSATLSSAAEKLLTKLQTRREELDEIRQLEDTEFEIPGLKLDLYGYQKVGVQFIDRAGGRCLIADAPGLGKTVQAIAYAQLHNLKALIVCPLSVVVNWQREVKKFTGKPATIWDSKTYDGQLGHQFHITHYDAVAKNNHWLRDQNFDLLVCDEATYLKNRQTIRAKSILGSYKERRKFPGIKTKYTIFLTGTPVMSRPIEAFSLLNFLDKERFNNFMHFTQRYGGWKGAAPMNLQDLHDRTKDLVIRRKKDQVLKELPNKQRNDLYVELTKDEKGEYNKLLKEMFGKWKMDGRPSIQHMPKLQGFLIEKKLPRLIELIDEFIDNDRSILIFSCYIKPLHALAQHYGNKAALLTGEMNRTARQTSIDRLIAEEAKVGLFSLRAAGMGIDGLQKVIDTVVFTDMGWLPAEHEQAEDRTHRIGQKGQVQVYYMMCEGTIDENMRDTLKEKQEIADMIVDGALVTPDRSKSMFKEFVKRINIEYRQQFETETLDE
jgi:SWI/SNF-related matrix-associated actin-dependent regulator 1 of chromatin subfamily A